MFPIAKNAQANKVRLLSLDLGIGVLAAGLPEGAGIEPLTRAPVGLFDLNLDGQTMTIPARHIRHPHSLGELGFIDDVLEHLVDRMTNMDAAVGVGRAVVQHVAGRLGAGLLQALVEVQALPMGQALGLPLRQFALHGEVGFRKI